MIEVRCAEHDISLKWFIIRYCNFNCPGCIEGINGNVRKFTKQDIQEQTEQAKKVGDRILNFLRTFENKTIKLTLTGGECSLIDFEYIFKGWDYVGNGNKLHITVITNFSASNSKYRNFFEMLDEYGITHTMTVSIHETYWKNFNYIINKVIDMKDYISCVNYVINDNNKDTILKYFHALEPYINQRLGVERNGKVQYLVSDDVWDIIKQCNVKKQIRWIEDGVLERLDMDTMLNERIGPQGFYEWTCYPIIQIMPDGKCYICHKNNFLDIEDIKFPLCVKCSLKKKCTPYNFIKCIKE